MVSWSHKNSEATHWLLLEVNFYWGLCMYYEENLMKEHMQCLEGLPEKGISSKGNKGNLNIKCIYDEICPREESHVDNRGRES